MLIKSMSPYPIDFKLCVTDYMDLIQQLHTPEGLTKPLTRLFHSQITQ